MRHRIISATILTLALLGLFIPLAVRASDGPEWAGVISARPSGATTGDWTIGGRTFSVSATTRIQEEYGPLATGACAEVKYYISGSANIATEVSSQEAYKCGGGGGGGGGDGAHRDSYARVEQFPAGLTGDWTIGGASYTATSATRFEQRNGGFAVGVCVEIKFSAVAGVNTAMEIETAPNYKCDGTSGSPGTSRSQAYGVLGTFPAGLVGAWDIGGVSYAATAATRFEQEHGPFFSGGCVDVKYQPASTTALEISTTDSYRCAAGSTQPEGFKVYGLISTAPAGGVGVWEIGGGQYTSTGTTLLRTEHGALDVGSCATVEYAVSAGVNTATKIASEELTKCNTSTFHNHIYGEISAMPAALYGTWTIGGMMIDANAGTRFEQERASLTMGGCAEASYYVQNGVSYANKIEARTAGECAGGAAPSPATTAKIYAPIDSLPAAPFIGAWSIGGVDYSATATTQFEQESAAFAAGVCVEARYATQGTTNTLLKVETKPAARCQQTGGAAVLRAYGVIEALPSPTGAGTWRVSGVDYSATLSTQLKQEYGFFSVGAYVEVSYQVSGATLTALTIETHVAPGAGRNTTVGDLQGGRPADDTGNWVINGVTYKGDPAITIMLSANSPQALAAVASSKVLVSSYRGIDGVQYITSIVTVVQQVYLPIVVR